MRPGPGRIAELLGPRPLVTSRVVCHGGSAGATVVPCGKWGIDMHVFMRQIRVLGGASAVGWAMEVTKRAREVTEMPVSLWAAAVGLPTGTLAWSTPVEGMTQLTTLNDKMQNDDELTKLIVEHGRDYIVDVMPDRLAMVIHGEIQGPAAIGSYMGGVTCVANNGKWGEAGAWAPKIADMYTDITGLPVVTTTTVAGPMGEFSWFIRHEDGASIDAADAAAMASEEYGAELDRAGDLFHPGVSWVYARRIA